MPASTPAPSPNSWVLSSAGGLKMPIRARSLAGPAPPLAGDFEVDLGLPRVRFVDELVWWSTTWLVA